MPVYSGVCGVPFSLSRVFFLLHHACYSILALMPLKINTKLICAKDSVYILPAIKYHFSLDIFRPCRLHLWILIYGSLRNYDIYSHIYIYTLKISIIVTFETSVYFTFNGTWSPIIVGVAPPNFSHNCPYIIVFKPYIKKKYFKVKVSWMSIKCNRLGEIMMDQIGIWTLAHESLVRCSTKWAFKRQYSHKSDH